MRKGRDYTYSVVIPCYNEADYIGNTLKSLKEQKTDVSYEIIVVDNNCTDETVAIARKYGVRVVSESIPGVCPARQTGTEAAKNDIVISTDADTVFASNWLQRIDSSFKAHPEYVAVGGPCRYYDGPWWGKIYTHFLFGWSYLYFRIFGHPYYITATNIAFKKSEWTGYDLNLMQGGDELGLLHQLRKRGTIGFSINNATYTSGRRLQKGLIYNVFVTFLFYYFGAYYINSIFKKNIIGAAPAFRKSYHPRTFMPKIALIAFIMLIVFVPLYFDSHRVSVFIYHNTKYIRPFIKRLF